MKKSVIILMLMCSIFMLASCGEVAETSSTDSKPSETSSSSQPINSILESTVTDEEQAIPPIYSDSADAILERLINSENWYHGEYSRCDILRGKTFNVEVYDELGTYSASDHYFLENNGEYVYVALTAADDPSVEPEIEYCYGMTKAEKEEEIACITEETITKNSEFELTVAEIPTDPNKLADTIEEELPEETLAEIDKLIECIDKGSGYMGKAYIRQIGNPYNREWKNYTKTDIFMEDYNSGDTVYLAYETTYSGSEDEKAYKIRESRKITKADTADWYYYNKIRQTTDWIVDTQMWSKSGLEFMPNTTVMLEDIPYNEKTEEVGYYLTSQGIKESIDICINSDLWYRGEYSPWYEKIGETYKVLCVTQWVDDFNSNIATTNVFLFPDEIKFDGREVTVTSVTLMKSDNVDMEINEDEIYTEAMFSEFDLMDCIGTELNVKHLSKEPEFTYTFKEPTKPVYGQSEMLEDRIDSVKYEIEWLLESKGFNEEIDVYIKPFIAEKEAWNKENDEDVTVEMNIFFETESGKVFMTSFGSTPLATNGAGFFDDFDLVDEAEEKYFYKQVKKATDIKFTLDITAGEEMMLDYIEEEYWVREDGEDYWFISVFAHTENGYYFSVTLENEDGTKTWDIDAIFDEDTGRFNYEECEIAKIDNDGMVEYLSESGSGYFYVKEGGLHWTDHTENISNWVFY